MRLILYYFLFLILSSCGTTSYVNYTDPNYLNSEEFDVYEEPEYQNTATETSIENDTTTYEENTSNYYYGENYSHRIRRFYKPMYYSGYYSGLYNDWYSYDPFYWGNSMYYGVNWHHPYSNYHNYWSYPYYSYYSPNYYSNFYRPYYYGYNYIPNHSSVRNNLIYGHRGSLTSKKKTNIKLRGQFNNDRNKSISNIPNRNYNSYKNISNNPKKDNISEIKNVKNNRQNLEKQQIRNTRSKKIERSNNYRTNKSNRSIRSYSTPKKNTTRKRK